MHDVAEAKPDHGQHRRRGVHLPQEETPPIEQERHGLLRTGYQAAETQLYLAGGTRGHPEFDDDGDSVSSGGPLSLEKCEDLAAGLGQ